MHDEQELCRKVTDILERAGARYFITGSIAAMYYGEARMTRDIDIVVDLRYGDVHSLEETFKPPQFWFDADLLRAAMQEAGQAMINDTSHGIKIDLMCAAETPFNASRFSRSRRVAMPLGYTVAIAAPEDVILMKLKYYQEGASDKHLRDIASMFKISGDDFDHAYLEHWAKMLGVNEELAAVRARVGW